jgi:hypothetical protein
MQKSKRKEEKTEQIFFPISKKAALRNTIKRNLVSNTSKVLQTTLTNIWSEAVP